MNRVLSRKWTLAIAALSMGAVLRLWFVHAYPVLDGDPLIYGDIAKNLVLHRVYGLSADGIHQTLIRLPGYPLFLALCFKLFGVEHYKAVMFVQVLIDLASCVLIAAFVRRVCGTRAAMVALWLGALCPFIANYVAAPLTETLSIFCVALALYSLGAFLDEPRPGVLLVLTFAISYAALLRPDGALLGVVFCPALVLYGRREWGWGRALKFGAICALLSVLPFVPWTIRNERTFHIFEPLAPRYAVDPGEYASPGFNRWMRTWCVEFASTYEVYWNADTDKIDASSLPTRTFDSPAQRQQTSSLLDDYNETSTLTPEIDVRFAALAAERIHAGPLRYYVELPLLRDADMWLRPRTENLPLDLRWWQYREHRSQTRFAVAYAALNLAYLIAAMAGVVRWPRFAGAMLAFVLLRSVLLATLEAPEPRYTLECFPMVIALAGVALARSGERELRSSKALSRDRIITS